MAGKTDVNMKGVVMQAWSSIISFKSDDSDSKKLISFPVSLPPNLVNKLVGKYVEIKAEQTESALVGKEIYLITQNGPKKIWDVNEFMENIKSSPEENYNDNSFSDLDNDSDKNVYEEETMKEERQQPGNGGSRNRGGYNRSRRSGENRFQTKGRSSGKFSNTYASIPEELFSEYNSFSRRKDILGMSFVLFISQVLGKIRKDDFKERTMKFAKFVIDVYNEKGSNKSE